MEPIVTIAAFIACAFLAVGVAKLSAGQQLSKLIAVGVAVVSVVFAVLISRKIDDLVDPYAANSLAVTHFCYGQAVTGAMQLGDCAAMEHGNYLMVEHLVACVIALVLVTICGVIWRAMVADLSSSPVMQKTMEMRRAVRRGMVEGPSAGQAEDHEAPARAAQAEEPSSIASYLGVVRAVPAEGHGAQAVVEPPASGSEAESGPGAAS